MKIEKWFFIQYILGGVGSNFLYQYFSQQNWQVAIERSYFLTSNILSFGLLALVINLLSNKDKG